MFFDLIRKCGEAHTDDGWQATTDKQADKRTNGEANPEKLRRLQGQLIQLQHLLHDPTIRKECDYGYKNSVKLKRLKASDAQSELKVL